ncbi:MAG: hypothetical protein MI924_00285, partial [Chloroflexales bacterium]|nr:hypothetical protein [Chloroflexales bacterium]
MQQTYARYEFDDGSVEIHAFDGPAPLATIAPRGLGFLTGAAVIAANRKQAETIFVAVDRIV